MIKLYIKKLTHSKIFYFFLGGGIVFAAIFLVGISKVQDSTKTILDINSFLPFKITSPEIPNTLFFAGEKVPLNDFEVRERIDRELIVNTYWFSSTILGMKRANRWFPVIEPILKKYNIPDDFKYLALIESNLSNASSSAGAVGFWQLTADAAKKYDLEVDDQVDERYNVERSTEAACKYLLDAHNTFNNWTLAAATFNMGFNGMKRQIDREKSTDYYNLILSDETMRYVARILAMKIIYSDAKKYGYYLNPEDLYPPLKTTNIKVDTTVDDWADFAIAHNINYKILKYYNPWLRDISLINTNNKEYILKIPINTADEVIPNGN